jgi:hypothetical protein
MTNLEILSYQYLKRNLNEDNFMTYEPHQDHMLEIDNLKKINLQREINITGIQKVFNDAQKTEKVRSFLGLSKDEYSEYETTFTDAFIGLNLHNLLRLSPSEASRPEVWNSIIFSQPPALQYLEYRKNLEIVDESKKKKLVLSDLFVTSTMGNIHQANKLSWPWWVVEVTRNGSSYVSALDAFKSTTYFTTRYIQSFLLHQRPIAIALSQYFAEFDNEPKRFNKDRRDVLATSGTDGLGQYSVALKDYFIEHRLFESIEIPTISNIEFKEWQESSSDFDFNSGPKDFEVKQESLKKVFEMFDEIGLKRGWLKTSL